MRIAVAFLFAVSLGGCAQWKASARISPQSVAEYSAPSGDRNGFKHPNGYTCPLTRGPHDSSFGAVNLDCFIFPEDREDKTAPTAYARAAGIQKKNENRPADWQAEAKLARDRLTGLLLKQADDVCVVEKGRLLATQTSANFGLSFLATALSTTSTIVVGEQAKSILSGLAAVSSSTQDNVNATFYQNQLTQAITKAIDAERTKVLTSIRSNRSSSAVDFSVDDMIRSVNEYHQACSFEKGLQLLLDAAVDSSGANAAQQTRAKRASELQLRAYIAELEAQRNAAGANPPQPLLDRLEAARTKLDGLILATTEDKSTGESATDTNAAPAQPAPVGARALAPAAPAGGTPVIN